LIRRNTYILPLRYSQRRASSNLYRCYGKGVDYVNEALGFDMYA
jgi:hypothetical protein